MYFIRNGEHKKDIFRKNEKRENKIMEKKKKSEI